MSVVWVFVCMNAHSVVEDWETAPFDGGFDGLAALGSRGFDGAVESAGTWLFFRDGDPIAVIADLRSTPRPGDIDAFEGASGTQYESPTPSAVTLAAMIALDGDVRGRYFTDDTPLSPDVSLRELAEMTGGYVGSDLESIGREAAIEALREDDDAETVDMKHFRAAMENVRPTITEEIRDYYEQMREEFKGGGPEPTTQAGGGRIGFQ
jgi:hypothetical protein